ncbi:MAG: DUF4446 family protein [Thermoleophilaceae bacterium]
MDELTSTTGIVALAAAGIAVLTLLFAVVLALKLRRVRAAQQAVLGDGQRDLVDHATRLERGFVDLREWVEEAMHSLDARLGTAEERIDGCIAYSALIRYDAYGEMSGRQSSSIALLDSRRSGVVLSSILHREQARLYAKPVRNGESEFDLSPEELEAIETALSAGARA